jgi:hypothetical protein
MPLLGGGGECTRRKRLTSATTHQWSCGLGIDLVRDFEQSRYIPSQATTEATLVQVGGPKLFTVLALEMLA